MYYSPKGAGRTFSNNNFLLVQLFGNNLTARESVAVPVVVDIGHPVDEVLRVFGTERVPFNLIGDVLSNICVVSWNCEPTDVVS
jgi:hypothetical protein